MKRQVACLLLSVTAIGCLTGCFEEQPGSPTASTGSGAVWEETIADSRGMTIGSMEACGISNSLASQMESIAQRFTVRDLQLMKEYLVQLDLYRPEDTDEGRYFCKIRDLYRSLYGIYTGSSESALLLAQLEEVHTTFDALPQSVRNELLPISSETLQAAASNIYRLADERVQ